MSGKSKEPSLRQRKVNSFLLQKISEIIRTEEFPGLTGLVTLTKVEVSPDLRDGKVFISVLGQDTAKAIEALTKRAFVIQNALYKKSTMKFVPKVRFVEDPSSEYSEHINKVLKEIHEKDQDKG